VQHCIIWKLLPARLIQNKHMSLKAVVNFFNGTNQLEESVGNFVTKAVEKSIAVMERNIKVRTPVKEGHLKRSIRSRMIDAFSGEAYNEAVEGGKEINYAIYQEYGTKYIAPRAMFRRGVADSEKRITDIFAEEARNLKNPPDAKAK